MLSATSALFFAKTSFVVGRRKSASDFMAEFEEEKKTQTRPGLFKKIYIANENGKNVKLCRFNKVQVFWEGHLVLLLLDKYVMSNLSGESLWPSQKTSNQI